MCVFFKSACCKLSLISSAVCFKASRNYVCLIRHIIEVKLIFFPRFFFSYISEVGTITFFRLYLVCTVVNKPLHLDIYDAYFVSPPFVS